MKLQSKKECLLKFYFFLFILIYPSDLKAQTLIQVWSDEFNGPTIDHSIWDFEIGPTNDNVHYCTDRLNNAKIVDGKLQIIALKESYQGFNYTSALLMTKNSMNWKYGRIEARIKLPGTPGFVPAFWLLPSDGRYGWWPQSGETDIMEHPSNEVTSIYGTVHTQAYNSFTGSGPRGDLIHIPDAETQFHIYAVEWTSEQIDFYVDNQKYFTFNNDHGASDTWPFNQPFYIILNLAVGGGWVGNPTSASVFPAVMEIDYVRVYQNLNDAAINGADFTTYNSQSIPYSVPNISGAGYSWNVPGDAQIIAGSNTNKIDVDWGIFGGDVVAEMTDGSGYYKYQYPVKVSYNYLKNAGFEKGVRYWNKAIGYPAAADFSLTPNDVHEGSFSLYVDVKTAGSNPWDVQLSQRNLMLNAGKQYRASFWAKSPATNSTLNAAIINSTNYTLYANKSIILTNTWTQYELNFAAPSNASASFNIDMGGHTGNFYFDNFVFTTPELTNLNQIVNADFTDGSTPWVFTTYSPAQANGSVQNGEYAISISNGGTYPWDINLGQIGFSIEMGKQYTVSFDAYATSPRQISALVGKNSSPWTVYSENQIFSLTTTKQTYTYSFFMSDPTDNQARLGFDIGTSLTDVFFDNVMLSFGETATLTVSPSNQPVTYEADSTKFTITSNTSWSVGDDATWLTVSPITGSNNDTLKVTFEENTTSSERVGTITISGGGIIRSVKVTQEVPTDIKDLKFIDNVPNAYMLFDNYPNPFNPSTSIRYAIPIISTVEIHIYNTLGQELEVFNAGLKEPGYYNITWQPKNLSSGIYFYTLAANSIDGKNNFLKTLKMQLMK